MTTQRRQINYSTPADWSELAESETQAKSTTRPQTFVPAVTPAQRRQDDAAALMAALQRGASPVIDVAPVWTPTESARTADSISAVDRAKGLQQRILVITVFLGLLALVMVIGYSIILWAFGSPGLLPMALDRITVFLLTIAAGGIYVFNLESSRDYDHSHAGIERLRITEAADLRRAEIQGELELRRMALDASLKLLGVDDDK